MARVNDIIFCLNSTNLPGQGACANTILSVLSPEYIPGLFSFSVIITLLDLSPDKKQKMRVVFKNDEEIVGELEGPLPVFDEPCNLPQEYKGINLAIDWNNMNLKKDGIYTLSVYIDDEKVKDKEIFVKGKNQ